MRMKVLKNYYFILSTFFIFTINNSAVAACVAPSGDIGELTYLAGDYLFCDGNDWVSAAGTNTGNFCSTEGQILQNGSGLEFCNGANWITFGQTTVTSCMGYMAGTLIWSLPNSRFEWCDGIDWKTIVGCGEPDQVFTANGTITVPATCKRMIVKAWGGGGGAGAASITGTGGSGGAGGYATTTFNVTALSTFSVTIGQGGTGVSTGCTGLGGTGIYAGGNGNGAAQIGGGSGLGGNGGTGGQQAGGAGKYGGGAGGDGNARKGSGGGGATGITRNSDSVQILIAGGGGGAGSGGTGSDGGNGGPGCAVNGQSVTGSGTQKNGGGGGGGACLGTTTINGSTNTPGNSAEAAGAGQGGTGIANTNACATQAGVAGKVIAKFN